MTQITAILDDDLAQKLDALAKENNNSRSGQVGICLIEYFKGQGNSQQETQKFTDQILLLNTVIQNKDILIKTLESQLGFLQSEFTKINNMNDRLMIPAPAATKKWYEVWK